MIRTDTNFARSTDAETNSVVSSSILDGTIVDADVNANAAIALSKLASGTAHAVAQFGPDGKLSALATGDSGKVLTSNGVGAALTWETPSGVGGDGTPYDGSVTLAKFDSFVEGSLVVGADDGGGQDPVLLTHGAANTVLASNGTTVAYTNVDTAHLADDAVTGAKIASALYKSTMSGVGVAADDRRIAFENTSEFNVYDATNTKRTSLTNTSFSVLETDGTTAAVTVSDISVNVGRNLIVAGDISGARWDGCEAFWKDDPKVIENATEKIRQLSGYTWTYSRDSPWPNQKSAGPMADEMQKVMPDSVKFNTQVNGRMVNAAYIHALTIQTVKEMDARLQKLEKFARDSTTLRRADARRIARLEHKNIRLQAQLVNMRQLGTNHRVSASDGDDGFFSN